MPINKNPIPAPIPTPSKLPPRMYTMSIYTQTKLTKKAIEPIATRKHANTLIINFIDSNYHKQEPPATYFVTEGFGN